MKRLLTLIAVCAALGASITTTPAYAGKIEKACKASERKAASSALCRCIQKAANVKLKRSDQRLAAKIFKQPDLAQETRQSSDQRKKSFWKRYKSFSAHAAKTCS